MKSFLIVIIIIILLSQIGYAGGATHEFGFGVSILNLNGNQNSDFGFNLYYDYSPINFLVIRSEISGQLFDNELSTSTSTRSTYFDEFYLNRESLSEKPQNSDHCYNFSYEESILYKTTIGKFKPFVGIGIGYHILSNSANLFVSNETKIYSLGYNIRGGFKYPLAPKLFASIEAKYTYTNYTNDIVNYNIKLGGGALIIQRYSTNELPNLNRLELHAGISFRL